MTESVGDFATLNDADIRDKLSVWLAREFAHDDSTVVYHEFVVPRPSARADVAVVNGKLSGFEIKSDLDTLARLPQQIPSYNAVFEHVTLVTTATHLQKALARIPAWWGVLLARPLKPLKLLRPARANKNLDVQRAMYLLSCAELQDISRRTNCTGISKARKADLITKLCQENSKDGLMRDIRDSLKSRIIQVDRRYRHNLADT